MMLRETRRPSGIRHLAGIRHLVSFCCILVLVSCGEDPVQPEAAISSTSAGAGFEAAITGSYQGTVSGNGVLVFLPSAGLDKKGYFFLADGRGIRDHGVTFVLPPGTTPGRHDLQNPSPLETGTMPSVRVDRDMGSSTLSADRNTSGFLDLKNFPNGPGGLNGAGVTGSFEFETANRMGEIIHVKGGFSFKAK
jgi:hypothetical protein